VIWIANFFRSSNERVIGIICFETEGHYSDEPKSKIIPPPIDSFFDHDSGNFLPIVNDRSSKQFLKSVVNQFASVSDFPSVGSIAEQSFVDLEISDQVSFGREGFKAIMVTDTLLTRSPKPMLTLRRSALAKTLGRSLTMWPWLR
jgi:hypothetical protein